MVVENNGVITWVKIDFFRVLKICREMLTLESLDQICTVYKLTIYFLCREVTILKECDLFSIYLLIF